jgi:hypothetical protein
MLEIRSVIEHYSVGMKKKKLFNAINTLFSFYVRRGRYRFGMILNY